MADVLLGQAYFLRFDPKLWRAMQPFAPLGTLYAAAFLRRHQHQVALFDAMLASSDAEWADALDRARPHVAVLYEDSFNYLSKMCLLRMREAALRMIDIARTRGCSVAVSGSDATDHPDVYLRAGATAVILGEGEVTLEQLVRAITERRSLADIDGLAYRSGDRIERTRARPFVRALDDLPLPARDLVDVDRYRRVWTRRHGHFAMNLAATRGCPFSCNWCAKPIYGQRYAVRAPGNVVEEMAALHRDYAPDRLVFVDDVFGLQPGWLDEFAGNAARRQVRMPFRCLMRADQIDANVVRALAAAGCAMVWMGAESGSQKVLDAMDKGIRVEQIRSAVRALRGAGIAVGMFLQFGYPGETWEDVERTLDLVRGTAPDDIGVSVSYPLPGTRFFERVRAELGSKRNWVDSDDLAMMHRAAYPPEFYRVLHHVVHHEFRSQQLAPTLKRVATRPFAVSMPDLRRLAAWAYHRAALPVAAYELRRLART